MPSTRTRAHWIALLIIVFLAFGLRMVQLGQLRMWGDEGYSVYSANRTLYAITFEGIDVDPHPPLYYYLLHFYLPLAGSSELAIRFFSVFFGTAGVALTYVLGKRLFDARVGLVAAALAALSPFAVHYSQEVRMYALVISLSEVALYLLVRLLEKESRRLWLGYAGAMLLTQYALYQSAFVFLGEGLFMLTLFRKRRDFVLRWFAVSIAVVILFLPWLVFRYNSAVTDVRDVAGDTVPMTLQTFFARGLAALTVGTNLPLSSALPFVIFFCLVVATGLAIALRSRAARSGDGLLMLLAVVPIVALYPVYYMLPLYRGRLFALALVPLVLLIARSLVMIGRHARWAAAALALLVTMTFGYSLNEYYFHFDRYSATVEDYIPAIQTIEQRARAGDVVLFHAYWQIGYFLSHYQGPPLEYRALDSQSDLDDAVSTSRNVWAIVQAMPYHGAEGWLAQHAFYLGEESFGQMRVISYRAGTLPVAVSFPVPVLFDNGIALLGYRTDPAPLESGRGAAAIELDWRTTQKVPEDWKISLRMVNAPSGSRPALIWAQADGAPVNGLLPTSVWRSGQTIVDRRTLAIPAGTPPGSYALQIVMYRSKDGHTASITAPDNLRAQALALASVSVVKARSGKSGATTSLPIPSQVDARWNEIALGSLKGGEEQVLPGDSLPLTLHWEADSATSQDYMGVAQLIDSAGVAHSPLVFWPASDTFPTHEWDPGDVWLDRVMVKVQADTAPGDASLYIGVTPAHPGAATELSSHLPRRDLQVELPGQQGPVSVSAVQVMRVKVTGRDHHYQIPSPQNPRRATLGGSVLLLGYDLGARSYRPGDTINLTLYWQALGEMSDRYTVFAHVTRPSGEPLAQSDGEPDGGKAPTTSWLSGEVIVDPYAVKLPPDAAPGEYSLIVGMYQATNGRRLTVSDVDRSAAADYVLLEKIRIQAP